MERSSINNGPWQARKNDHPHGFTIGDAQNGLVKLNFGIMLNWGYWEKRGYSNTAKFWLNDRYA